jgi:hypothetical protein
LDCGVARSTMINDTTTETTATIVAKAAPPATVSLATIAGYQVSELVLWATLIYTVLLIGHKLLSIYKEFKDGN